MAGLRQILSNEDMKASEKVSAIVGIVNKARAKYGNEDAEISVPEVGTCEGVKDLTLLSDEDKVAIADRAVDFIITQATETVKSTEGAVLDKEIERLLATNSVLVNLAESVDSDYI